MHALLALFAAAAVQAAPADTHATKDQTVTCRWEAGQSNGIPVKVCMTPHQRKLRATYMQQQIRENQMRSYTTNN
jgi:hypothetical protein